LFLSFLQYPSFTSKFQFGHSRYTAWVRTLTQAVYRQATRNSHREWQYHMLHEYNCIVLKMSTWGSKHVEEISILWINNNQCIKLVINIQSVSLQSLSETFLVIRRIQPDTILNLSWSSWKLPVIHIRLQWILNLSDRFLKNSPDIKFRENVSSGGRVVPRGQTDMKKLVVPFSNFANTPQNKISHCYDK
jgi:hypothetical protein